MENVPAEVCSECGEVILPLSSLEATETMLKIPESRFVQPRSTRCQTQQVPIQVVLVAEKMITMQYLLVIGKGENNCSVFWSVIAARPLLGILLSN